MKFLSLCSGIEAASVAFGPLGWQAVAFSEIEPFPCALLAHHYPAVPNIGDMTRWRTWPDALLVQVEILVGGTPCQAFSLAGLRQSLDDARGNLTLIYCEIYAHINALRRAAGLPPALCLWENVPGVLSTKDNAFGCFLAGLAGESLPLQPPGGRWADAGYVSGPSGAAAYRTLDAQYFGLAQRRRRVFVVGSPDPAFDPAAVLFEFHGLRRDTPPRRQTGETTAHELAPSLTSSGRGVERPSESRGQDPVVAVASETGAGHWTADELARLRCTTAPTQPQTIVAAPATANCLTRRMSKGPNTTLNEGPNTTLNEGPTLLVEVTHSLRAEGFDDSEDGTGRGTPLVPIAFSAKDHGADSLFDLFPTLRAGGHDKSHANSGNWAAIAFPERLSSTQCVKAEDLSPVLQSHNPTAVAFKPRHYRHARKDGAASEVCGPLTANMEHSGDTSPHVAYDAFAFDLRGREGGAMPEGPHPTAALRASSSRSYIAAPLPFDTTQITSATNRSQPAPGDPCRPLSAQAHPPALAYTVHGTRDGTQAVATPTDTAGTIREGTGSAIQNSSNTVALSLLESPETTANNGQPSPTTANAGAASLWRVRRLVCEECELLQGFPLGYTLIPHTSPKKRKGPDLAETTAFLLSLDIGLTDSAAATLAHSPDGPRYKALGNSWPVPVVRWIAQRIDAHRKTHTAPHATP